MAHFVLIYELAPDYLERRAALRERHLTLAWEATGKSGLLLGGALGDPVDTALLLFEGEDSSTAEDFARNDPYVVEGLVTRWRVRPWATVVGGSAADPVRPA